MQAQQRRHSICRLRQQSEGPLRAQIIFLSHFEQPIFAGRVSGAVCFPEWLE